MAIPVAYLDERELAPTGGNWISLDLRGLLVGSYLIAAGIVAIGLLLHLSVKRLGKPFSFGLVMACSLAPAVAVPIGYAIYEGSLHPKQDQRARQLMLTRDALADSLQLRWTLLAAEDPPLFEVELTSTIPLEVRYVSVSGAAVSRGGPFISSSLAGQDPPAFRLVPGVPRRLALTLDHSPSADTYWNIYCSLAANGTTVGVT